MQGNSASELNNHKTPTVRSWVDLTKILTTIRTFLTDTLKLSLHSRKVRIFPTRLGVDFVGYVVFTDHILLRPKNVRHFMKKLRKQQKSLASGKITQKEFEESVRSWIAHAVHADTFGLRRKLFASANLPAFSPVPSSTLPNAQTGRAPKTSIHRLPVPLPARLKAPHQPAAVHPTAQLSLFGYWPGSPAPKTARRRFPTADPAQIVAPLEKC